MPRTHRRPERPGTAMETGRVTPPHGGHGCGNGTGHAAARQTRQWRRGRIRTGQDAERRARPRRQEESGCRTTGAAARPGPYHPVFAALAADQAMYVGIVRQITHDDRIADAGRHEIFRFADLAGIIGPAHPEPVSEIIDGALFTEIAVRPSPVSGPVSDASVREKLAVSTARSPPHRHPAAFSHSRNTPRPPRSASRRDIPPAISTSPGS